MPITAINWNPSTQQLAIIHARNCTINKNGNKILIDQTPTFDRSTDPWGITEGNEVQVGQLTGNLSDAEKKAAVIAWVNEYCFMFIMPLTDFPADDPYRIADPAISNAWWSDEHGVPDAAGTHVTEQYLQVVDFDAVALLNDDVLITTVRKV